MAKGFEQNIVANNVRAEHDTIYHTIHYIYSPYRYTVCLWYHECKMFQILSLALSLNHVIHFKTVLQPPQLEIWLNNNNNKL